MKENISTLISRKRGVEANSTLSGVDTSIHKENDQLRDLVIIKNNSDGILSRVISFIYFSLIYVGMMYLVRATPHSKCF
jgi:phosphoserine aminotransferase